MQTSTAVRQFCKGYFATSARSHNTQKAYTCDLSQFAQFVRPRTRIQSITASRVESWSHQLQVEGYASASIKRKLATLRIFFLYWVRMKKLSASPMSLLRINFGPTLQLPKCLTAAEMQALLGAARARVTGHGSESTGRLDRAFVAPNDDFAMRQLRKLRDLPARFRECLEPP